MDSVFCVIDRSGSMVTCEHDTTRGFNAFVSDQPQDTLVTTFLFNSHIKELYRFKRISDVVPLDSVTYRPRGCTALLDAIGSAIGVASNCTADTITVVIITDGEENSSTIYSRKQVRDLIEEKKGLGWKFVFMGANQDAICVAGDLGIDRGGALTFDTRCVGDAFRCISDAVCRVRTGESQDIEFSRAERQSSCPI